MDFAVPADYRMKIKDSEKLDKDLDFAKELKKFGNIKVTVIPVIEHLEQSLKRT